MTFVAIGYAVCSIIVAVVRKFVLLLPLIFIVPMFVSNKTMGIYMAEPIADAIAVTFTAIFVLNPVQESTETHWRKQRRKRDIKNPVKT